MTTYNNHNQTPTIHLKRDGQPKHSTSYRMNHSVLTFISLVVCFILTFVTTFACASVWELNRLVKSGSVTKIAQESDEETSNEPTILDDLNAGRSVQFLIIGQDTRDGDGNAAIGGADPSLAGNHQADTTIIVQISADRQSINMVSISRDTLVNVPSCNTTNGTIPAQSNIMFNSIFAQAYRYGGDLASAASCTLNAVNSITGLSLQEFIVADFAGLSSMIDAIGGVDICIPFDMYDEYTGLSLTTGMQHLNGTLATQYARTRHATNTDGSDIMRTTRQQYLLKTLIRQALQKNILTNIPQLYQLAKSAITALNMSSGLANINLLAGLAMSLRNLNTDNVFAQTAPITAAPNDPNRVVFASIAENLWATMRSGQALGTVTASTTDSDASSSDTSSSESSSSDAGDTASETSSDAAASDAQTADDGIDPNTGLITDAYGNLIDPTTGGYVNASDGSIRDSVTGYFIGIADRYVLYTFCGVTQ